MRAIGITLFFCLISSSLLAQVKRTNVYFGETKIALPKIAAMTECYAEPVVKLKASRVFNGRGMSILGLYLPDAIYKKIDILDAIPFDGYFLLYGQENMKNVKGNIQDLRKVAKIMRESFGKLEWDIDDITIEDKLINIGKPVLIEEYSLKNEVVSFIGLTYCQADGVEYIGMSIMNMMNIKGKLLTMTGYFNYRNKDSIEKAKAKNDYAVLRFLDENK